ncbi:MAG: hypothetical protein ACRDEA_05130, partial [Microcystaceae cyanobacterium]
MTTRTPAICHKIPLENNWTLNVLSQRIATITDPRGNRKTTYFGFDTFEEAEAFRKTLLNQQACSQAILRRAERLSTAWECKVGNCTTELIVKLLNRPQSLVVPNAQGQESPNGFGL